MKKKEEKQRILMVLFGLAVAIVFPCVYGSDVAIPAISFGGIIMVLGLIV